MRWVRCKGRRGHRVDTWKGQLESLAASSDGLGVLMYHISNTYDTYHMTWRAPFALPGLPCHRGSL